MIPEAALFAFGALTLMFAVVVSFDPRTVGSSRNTLGPRGARPARRTARPKHGYSPSGEAARGIVSDPMISRSEQPAGQRAATALRRTASRAHRRGPSRVRARAAARVHRRAEALHALRRAAVHRRHPDSIARTWALLISARSSLYPGEDSFRSCTRRPILGSEDDTIMSGVALFWNDGDYPLAAVIFIASILVPMLKLVTLALSRHARVQRRSTLAACARTTLFRVVEGIGRWSMLDVFDRHADPSRSCASSRSPSSRRSRRAGVRVRVVVLTMIASMQFDPRLMWDNIEPSRKI